MIITWQTASRKTFARRYRVNVGKALELLCGFENGEDTARSIADKILEENGFEAGFGV